MHWKTFLALPARDGHVARRNFCIAVAYFLAVDVVPVYLWKVMVRTGYMPSAYKSPLFRDHGD
jgi:hypothetical protein